jgi:hypothetical protein
LTRSRRAPLRSPRAHSGSRPSAVRWHLEALARRDPHGGQPRRRDPLSSRSASQCANSLPPSALGAFKTSLRPSETAPQRLSRIENTLLHCDAYHAAVTTLSDIVGSAKGLGLTPETGADTTPLSGHASGETKLRVLRAPPNASLIGSLHAPDATVVDARAHACLRTFRDVGLEGEILSVFVYGSASRREEPTESSDVELGVIPRPGRRLGRRQLAALAPDGVRAYAFDAAALRAGRARVPFTASIFLRDVALSAATIFGADVVETMPAPPITAGDLLSEARFTTGRLFGALISARAGDNVVANESFAKGVLYGARVLVASRRRTAPVGFQEIAIAAERELSAEDSLVLAHALATRAGRHRPGVQDFYAALEFLTDVVEPAALDWCTSGLDRVVVSGCEPRCRPAAC